MRRRRHDGAVPAAEAAGGARLPAGRDAGRVAPSGPAVRRRRGGSRSLRAGHRPLDVLAGARVQPPQADSDRTDGRRRRGDRMQPDAGRWLPDRARDRLDRLREPVRRRGARHLQHHHHRQGVRRAEGAAGPFGDRARDPDRRGSDRDPAPGGAHRGGLGARLEAAALARTVGRLAGFLVVLLAVGMLMVPRLVRAVVRLDRAETTVVATVGICFAFALLARKMGYSVALGAFLGGALVAESGEAKIIEHRIEPVRDLFAAIFFVSVGMLIDPQVIWTHAGTVLL